MPDINKKINNKHIIGELTLDGNKYYVDVDKAIYVCINGKYEEVKDRQTLQNILNYISPKSIDLEI